MISWFEKKKKEKKAVWLCAEGAKAYINEQFISPEEFAAPADGSEVTRSGEEETLKSRLTDEYYENVLKDVYGEKEQEAQFVQLDGTPSRSIPQEKPSFSQAVEALMKARDMDAKAVSKAARIDKAQFDKIMSEPDCVPSKDNAVAIAAALRLSKEGAAGLLSAAGYELSHSDKRDMAIEYCFKEELYDVRSINAVLEKLGEKKLEK